MQIIDIPNDCSATEHLPFGCGAAYELLGLLFNYSGCGTYSQATPELLNACNCEYKQKFEYSVLHLLALEDQFSATGKNIVVHLDTFWISST